MSLKGNLYVSRFRELIWIFPKYDPENCRFKGCAASLDACIEDMQNSECIFLHVVLFVNRYCIEGTLFNFN